MVGSGSGASRRARLAAVKRVPRRLPVRSCYLQLVGERHQFIEFSDDAVLLNYRWEGKRQVCKSFLFKVVNPDTATSARHTRPVELALQIDAAKLLVCRDSQKSDDTTKSPGGFFQIFGDKCGLPTKFLLPPRKCDHKIGA